MKPYTQNEINDMVVGTLLNWQKDLFMFNMNKERFERIVADKDCPEQTKVKLEGAIKENVERIKEVEAYVRAIQPELPTGTDFDEAVARVKEKEKANEELAKKE